LKSFRRASWVFYRIITGPEMSGSCKMFLNVRYLTQVCQI